MDLLNSVNVTELSKTRVLKFDNITNNKAN